MMYRQDYFSGSKRVKIFKRTPIFLLRLGENRFHWLNIMLGQW